MLSSAQYENLVIETQDEWDYIYTHDYRNGKNYSVGAIYDSNSTLNGFTTITFRVYDENFQKQIETRYTDSAHQYTGFYGLEYHKYHYYHCGTKGVYPNFDTLKGFVIKYDTLGNVIWEKNYYSNDEDVRINFMASDDSLVYLLTNIYNPSTTGEIKTVLTAIDSSGTVMWDKDFSGLFQKAKSLRLTSDGGFLISVSSAVTGNVTKTIVYKLDSLHNTLWSKTLGPATEDHYLQFFEMPSGNYMGVGQSEDLMSGRVQSWLVELNSVNGIIVKDTIYLFSNYLHGFSIYSDAIYRSNEMIFTGVLNEQFGDQTYKGFVTSIGYNYEVNWIRKYAIRNIDNSIFGMYEKNGFFYLQGIAKGDAATDTYDEWFLVVDSLGCDDQWCTVGIGDAMYQYSNENNVTIYPNPTSGQITFQFETYQSNREILITDIMGKEIDRIISNESLINYVFTKEKSGIYLVHILNNGVLQSTQKVVLQR